MIPTRWVSHGFLGSRRIVADFPSKHAPAGLVRAPTSDPAACLFLRHQDAQSGIFWLIDCAHTEPEITAIPASVVPDSFAFYVRDNATYIVMTSENEVLRVRYSHATRQADQIARLPFNPRNRRIVGCTPNGDVLFATNTERTYFNWHECMVYELTNTSLQMRVLSGSGMIVTDDLAVESDCDMHAVRQRLFFASADEFVVGPAPAREYESHVVVPWECRMHPHRPLYLRAQGNMACFGNIRATGAWETRSDCDGPVRAVEWLDTDGYVAATDSELHFLFVDVERVGWLDFAKEVGLYYLPILGLFMWVGMEMIHWAYSKNRT